MKAANTFQAAYLSPFRWAGSKRKSLPTLERFWSATHRRYVEPFCGSACLFFRLAPSRAILSDVNADLIHAFKAIRKAPLEVHKELCGFRVDEPTYYSIRALDPAELIEVQRAARFIYLNRFCFNGLYRTNTAGHFNVPYGAARSGSLPSSNDLLRFARVLKHAQLVCCDFERAVACAEPGDFVYFDSPYHLQTVRTFRQYDATDFDFGAVWRLRSCLEALHDKRIAFLVSYAGSEEGEFLARGFLTQRIQVGRNIAGFAANRRRYTEMLIYPGYARPR